MDAGCKTNLKASIPLTRAMSKKKRFLFADVILCPGNERRILSGFI